MTTSRFPHHLQLPSNPVLWGDIIWNPPHTTYIGCIKEYDLYFKKLFESPINFWDLYVAETLSQASSITKASYNIPVAARQIRLCLWQSQSWRGGGEYDDVGESGLLNQIYE